MRSCRLTSDAYHSPTLRVKSYHSPTLGNSLPPPARVKSYSYSVIVGHRVKSERVPNTSEHCRAVTTSTVVITFVSNCRGSRTARAPLANLSSSPLGQIVPGLQEQEMEMGSGSGHLMPFDGASRCCLLDGIVIEGSLVRPRAPDKPNKWPAGSTVSTRRRPISVAQTR